jgi:ubiquinone biosynthesis protein
MDWVKIVYRPIARRAARRALVGRVRDRSASSRGRFTRADARRLLDGSWLRYDQASPTLAPQPTLGSAMNVRLACFTFSFFEELLAAGTERSYAIELVADATWAVYEVWARVASAIAGVTPWKSASAAFAVRDRLRGTLSLRFPFNAPGYLIHPVASDGAAAFDVVRCPVAAYFREHGSADLCLASWCNLDYPLSEMTHQRLVRTRTLVEGADRCDFRVQSLPSRSGA